MVVWQHSDNSYPDVGYSSIFTIALDEENPDRFYVEIDASEHEYEENVLAVLIDKNSVRQMLSVLKDWVD